jgi:hypothetical protein
LAVETCLATPYTHLILEGKLDEAAIITYMKVKFSSIFMPRKFYVSYDWEFLDLKERRSIPFTDLREYVKGPHPNTHHLETEEEVKQVSGKRNAETDLVTLEEKILQTSFRSHRSFWDKKDLSAQTPFEQLRQDHYNHVHPNQELF